MSGSSPDRQQHVLKIVKEVTLGTDFLYRYEETAHISGVRDLAKDDATGLDIRFFMYYGIYVERQMNFEISGGGEAFNQDKALRTGKW